jgi:hypothetical protein
MFNWILAHIPAYNGWIALLLFWAPLVLCAYGYFVLAVQGYRKDLATRAAEEAVVASGHKSYYTPELTVGVLVGYLLCTIIPVVNLIASIFYIGPKVFGEFFEWLGKALDIPLVPKRTK